MTIQAKRTRQKPKHAKIVCRFVRKACYNQLIINIEKIKIALNPILYKRAMNLYWYLIWKEFFKHKVLRKIKLTILPIFLSILFYQFFFRASDKKLILQKLIIKLKDIQYPCPFIYP